MQSIEAAQLPLDSQRGRALDEILVDLDDAKRQPLVPKSPDWNSSSRQTNGRPGRNNAHTTGKPAASAVHRLADQTTPRLGDIALDERACIEIEVQRSASRSDSTSEDALRRAFTRRGALLGLAREGTTNRPSATSGAGRPLPQHRRERCPPRLCRGP